MNTGEQAVTQHTAHPPAAPSRRLGAAAILVVAAVALTLGLSRLGARSLLGDEAIYAIVAREAAVHGHWYPLTWSALLGPRALFAGKPPLCAWGSALSFSLLGVDEWADRLPSALAGAATAVLVCAFATWLFDPWTGALAGLLLATCRPWLFAHGARDGVPDPLLTLLLSAALLLYLRYRSTARRAWLVAAGAAAGLGTLCKGPLVLLLPLAIALCWEIVTWATGTNAPEAGGAVTPATPAIPSRHRLSQLAKAFGHSAAFALIGLVPCGIWMADNLAHVPGFAATLQRENLQRALHGIDPSHLQGPTFYLEVWGDAFGHWWIGLLPAAAVLVRLRRRGGARARAALLLPLWAAVVTLGLSLSVSKLSWYLDPAFPAVAALLALGFGEVGRRLARWPQLRLLFGLALLALLGARAVAAWRTLAQPVRTSPMHRLALAVHQRPQARLYLDDLRWGVDWIREWNLYYMTLLDDVARPLPAALDHNPCTFVITTHAARLLVRPDFRGAMLVAADRHSERESDLELVDLCAGVLARQ